MIVRFKASQHLFQATGSVILSFLIMLTFAQSADRNSQGSPFVSPEEGGLMRGLSLRLGDSESQIAIDPRGGRNAFVGKKEAKPGSRVFRYYVLVEDAAFRNGLKPNVELAIEYFDQGPGSAFVEYDSSDPQVQVSPPNPGAWKRLPPIHLAGSSTWKTYTAVITDAKFARRCHGGDLRITWSAPGNEPAVGTISLREPSSSAPRDNKPVMESNKMTIQQSPNGIEIIRGLEIGKAGDIPLLVDIAKPKQPDKLSPAILAIHGGGWGAGSRVDALAGVRFLAEKGYFVYAVDYRLAKQAKWPAQIEDCKYAVRWLRSHAAEYQVDPQRIGAWGHSAGAHLAACLGTIGAAAGMEGISGYSNMSSQVQAVAAWCPPIGVADFLKHDLKRLFSPTEITNPMAVSRANPTSFITRGVPPFLLAHGDRDTVVPIAHSERFATALRAAGNPVDFVVVKGAGHRMRAETNEIESSPSLAELEVGLLKFFDQHLRTP